MNSYRRGTRKIRNCVPQTISRPAHPDARARRSADALRYAVEPLESRLLLSTSVTQFHGDAANTGWYQDEPALSSSADFDPRYFGKLFSTTLSGSIVDQPYFLPGLDISTGPYAGIHDAVIVTTQNAHVIAIDAHVGSVLYDIPLATVANAVPQTTAVTLVAPFQTRIYNSAVDPATDSLFTVVITREKGFTDVDVARLYKVDLATGDLLSFNIVTRENVGIHSTTTPLAINRTGISSQLSPHTLDPTQQSATVIRVHGDTVYVGWGGQFGMLTTFNASDLSLQGAFDFGAANGGAFVEGIDFAANDDNAYVATGNGVFNTTGFDAAGFPTSPNYGYSFIKIGADSSSDAAHQNKKTGWGLAAVDYFHSNLINNGAGNSPNLPLSTMVALPDAAGSAAHPHLLVGTDIIRRVMLIDRDNMGKFNPTTDQNIQTISSPSISRMYTQASYANGRLYISNDSGLRTSGSMVAFDLSNASISGAPTLLSTTMESLRSGNAAIASDGLSGGVVWVSSISSTTDAELIAYDAGNMAKIWDSDTNFFDRDKVPPIGGNGSGGNAALFVIAPPLIADGQIFLIDQNALGFSNSGAILVSYGFLPPAAAPPAPPSSLAAVGSSDTTVDLAFTDNASNEDGDNLQISTDGVHFTDLATAYRDSTGWTATALLPDHDYWFRVNAFNNFNGHSDSDFSNTVLAHTRSVPPNLDFSTGFASAAPLLNLQGVAKYLGADIQLTDFHAGERSSIWSVDSQRIDRFSTHFSFNFNQPFADGFNFVVQSSSNTFLETSPQYGGVENGYAGLDHSVAIRFILNNPFANGTGIDFNGASIDSGNHPPAISTYPVNFFAVGHQYAASIDYDGTTLAEIVSDLTNGAVFSHSYTVDIPALLGSNSGFVGFTAATGGGFMDQRLNALTFSSNFGGQPAPTLPTVERVDVGSTSWSEDYINNFISPPYGSTTGATVSTPYGQSTSLYWFNLNTVSITFNEDVVVSEGDLFLHGVNVPTYGFTAFTYNPAKHTATWTLAGPIGPDKLLIFLSDNVRSDAGVLDGEWTAGSGAAASGDGSPGGNFLFRFNVLPGDVTNDSAVLGSDVIKIRNNQGGQIGEFSGPWDVNGDNTINGADVILTRNAQFITLPAGEPAAPLAPAAAPPLILQSRAADIAAPAEASSAPSPSSPSLSSLPAASLTAADPPTPSSSPLPAVAPALAPVPLAASSSANAHAPFAPPAGTAMPPAPPTSVMALLAGLAAPASDASNPTPVAAPASPPPCDAPTGSSSFAAPAAPSLLHNPSTSPSSRASIAGPSFAPSSHGLSPSAAHAPQTEAHAVKAPTAGPPAPLLAATTPPPLFSTSSIHPRDRFAGVLD